jgi:sarcosine oxidase, subunit beta
MKTDIVIIGGGIVGCAAAYYLSKSGLQVLVVEKDAAVGLQASGRNGGGVRQHGRKAALPLAMESVKLWGTLEKDLQADLEYSRTGNLKIAFEEASAQDFEREFAWERENGLNEVRMLSASECHEMLPGMTGKALAGKICSSDGVANPMLATPAFARAARKLGVKFLLNTTVTGLLWQGSTVCGIKTASDEIEAGVVINAAGPWAARFAAEAGCPIIIGPGRSQLMVTERLRHPFIDKWITLRGIGYLRPTRSNNLVIGSSGTRNDQYSSHVNYHAAAIQAELLGRVLPELEDVKIIRAFAGITEYTPDMEPYIGAVPGVPGLFIAAGFSGEGFCPGPLVGKIMAELISGNEPSVSLMSFRPDRFADVVKNGKASPPVKYPFDSMGRMWLADANITYEQLCG